MSLNDWKERAKALFFIERYNIEQISNLIGISRRSISKYLNSQPDYENEITRRKSENAARRKKSEKTPERKEYKRNWDRKSRSSRYSSISKETLKNEHITLLLYSLHGHLGKTLKIKLLP